jgi:hypothetical protein
MFAEKIVYLYVDTIHDKSAGHKSCGFTWSKYFVMFSYKQYFLQKLYGAFHNVLRDYKYL